MIIVSEMIKNIGPSDQDRLFVLSGKKSNRFFKQFE